MTSCTGSARGGFWWFWKSQLVESCCPRKKGDIRLLAEALWWVLHVMGGGGRWKSHHRKIVPLSPYVEKRFNSKVIKRFRTWTKKSLRVCRVSGFLCSMYICYEHSMYVSHIHEWVCYRFIWYAEKFSSQYFVDAKLFRMLMLYTHNHNDINATV